MLLRKLKNIIFMEKISYKNEDNLALDPQKELEKLIQESKALMSEKSKMIENTKPHIFEAHSNERFYTTGKNTLWDVAHVRPLPHGHSKTSQKQNSIHINSKVKSITYRFLPK